MESESLLGTTPELYHPTMSAETFWGNVGHLAVIGGVVLITYWGIKALVTGSNPLKSETHLSQAA